MLRRVFMIATVGWAAALPIAAWTAVRPGAWPLSAFAFGMYAVGGLICHQLPERSFHLWSMPLPVCARCTGIYVGGAMAAIVGLIASATAPLKGRPPPVGHRFSGAGAHAKATLLVAALPTLATIVFEWTTGRMPAHWVRALAGVPIGAAVVWVIASAIAQDGALTRVNDGGAPRESK